MKMKRPLLIASVLALTLSIGLIPAFAQKGKHPRAVSSRAATDKGNPKYAIPTTPDKSGKPAPPQKGGAKPKGKRTTGVIHVDNRTGYNVYVFEDGVYVGPLGAYGDIYYYSPSGTHEMYAESAGGTTHWGPQDLYVDYDGSSSWTLH
jgi:hypothetical protein